MTKRSLIEAVDQAVQAMLAEPGSRVGSAEQGFDAQMESLVEIARKLGGLPREGFKAELKRDLERRSQVENAMKQAKASGTTQETKLTAGGYRTIAPYIIVPRAAEFVEFLKAAFDGTERMRMPIAGTTLIMHAEVAIGNCVIELADANEHFAAAPMAIHLYVDDADASYERALKAGAKSIYPVGEHVSGDRQGAVRDPFGNVWYVAMIQGWTPGPEGVASVQPYLHVRGSEKMIPFLQSAFGANVLGPVHMSPEGHVLHATIQIGDNTLEVDEAHGEFQPMGSHLHLHIDDADAMYARAIAAGATSIEAPSNKPYGRSGGVRDPFGNSWFMTSAAAT